MELANLIKQAAAAGAIRVVHIAGRGMLLEIPDGHDFDYVRVGECGHYSDFYCKIEDSLRWSCDLCDEQRVQARDAFSLRARLDHLLPREQAS